MELDLDILDAMLGELSSDKPRIRVRAGEVITNQMLADALGIAMPEPKPSLSDRLAALEAPVVRKRLDLRTIKLVAGMMCPRCHGSGQSEWGNCFWCTAESKPRQSWGVLTHKDIGLINARMNSEAPVCDVVI